MQKKRNLLFSFLLIFYISQESWACKNDLLGVRSPIKRVSFVDMPTVYILDQETEVGERILGMLPDVFTKSLSRSESHKSFWKRVSEREKVAMITAQNGMQVPDVLSYFGISSDFISFSYDNKGGIFETQKHFYIVNSEHIVLPPSIQWRVLCRKKAEWPFCIFSSDVVVRRYNNRLFYIPQD